jgi:hypothetical protein
MTIRERLAGLGLRELLPSFIHACLAIAALMLLTDRLQRVAKSATADRSWTAATGQTLRLAGLDEGPLLGIEGTPGGGITVVSDQATLTDGGAVQPVKWMAQGDSRGDYKAKVEISIVGKDGDVVLNRVGEAVTPQVQIQVKNAKLRVDVGVTVGDSLTMPKTRVVVGERDLPPAGPGFSYIVPDGDSLSVEYPEPSNDQPSGVATWLGSVREKEQDTILPLREVAIVPEDRAAPGQLGMRRRPTLCLCPLFPSGPVPIPDRKGLQARDPHRAEPPAHRRHRRCIPRRQGLGNEGRHAKCEPVVVGVRQSRPLARHQQAASRRRGPRSWPVHLEPEGIKRQGQG